jgi:3-deoxy-manno-octulosonate cytidylyltransferase (CMP-KDO synthetase)
VDILGVIPARFASTRFPGKPLKLVAGKPLLQWVVEAVKSSKKITQVWVATDDERIAELAKSLNVKVAMTDSELPTGSDRVWQAVKNSAAEIVVNIQGDEPLLRGEVLDSLIQPMIDDRSLEMATLGRPLNEEALLSPNTAKIVLNAQHEAIYFSRFPIPFSRQKWAGVAPKSETDAELQGLSETVLKHVGLYAYRKSFLEKFCAQKPVGVEILESLEQLRALYLGARIKVVRTEHESWGVDTPEDVAKIEAMIAKNLAGQKK